MPTKLSVAHTFLQGAPTPYPLLPGLLPPAAPGPSLPYPCPLSQALHPTKTQAGLWLAFHTQMQEAVREALPGAGPGASSTSGVNYQRWLRSGLLCLPLTYLPG